MQKIYIVQHKYGSYESYSVENVLAFRERSDAEAFASTISELVSSYWKGAMRDREKRGEEISKLGQELLNWPDFCVDDYFPGNFIVTEIDVH